MSLGEIKVPCNFPTIENQEKYKHTSNVKFTHGIHVWFTHLGNCVNHSWFTHLGKWENHSWFFKAVLEFLQLIYFCFVLMFYCIYDK